MAIPVGTRVKHYEKKDNKSSYQETLQVRRIFIESHQEDRLWPRRKSFVNLPRTVN
jgi:hypothetical protein